jgi:hypothetical protein
MITEERLAELESSASSTSHPMRAELRELVGAYRTRANSPYIDIVFDRPPSHESGRFLEVEDSKGASIRVGEWVQRPDSYWVLRIRRDPIGDKLRSLPVIGVLNVDNPRDPRHKEWKL